MVEAKALSAVESTGHKPGCNKDVRRATSSSTAAPTTYRAHDIITEPVKHTRKQHVKEQQRGLQPDLPKYTAM